PTRTKKLAFSNLLRSDGFTADVVLYKKVNQGADDYSYSYDQVIDVEHIGKTVEQQELDQFSLCGVDPDRKHIFTAAFEETEQTYIRRCSTKEYYTMTGSVRIAKQTTQRMNQEGLTDVFLNIPTSKTASITSYFTYVNYIFLNFQQILAFNNNTSETHLDLYQGVQRAYEEIVNILVNGGRKYNKCGRKIKK
ncbi:hypothetical protein BDF14DRAFT_1728070, partial [Spinellus fusiger]